jgi:hypothetical protein
VKRDREEVTAEKEAIPGVAEEPVEDTAGVEGEVTAAGEEAVGAEAMTVGMTATAGKIETVDRHRWKRAKKLTSP